MKIRGYCVAMAMCLPICLLGCSDSEPESASVEAASDAVPIPKIRDSLVAHVTVLPEGKNPLKILPDGSVVFEVIGISITLENNEPLIIEAWRDGEFYELHHIPNDGKYNGHTFTVGAVSGAGAVGGIVSWFNSVGEYSTGVYFIDINDELVIHNTDKLHTVIDLANDGTLVMVGDGFVVVDRNGDELDLEFPDDAMSIYPKEISDDSQWIFGDVVYDAPEAAPPWKIRAVLWHDKKVRILPLPSGAVASKGHDYQGALAPNGLVTGTIHGKDQSNTRSVIWHDGSVELLGTPNDGLRARTMNLRGDVLCTLDEEGRNKTVVAIRNRQATDLVSYLLENSEEFESKGRPLLSTSGLVCISIRPAGGVGWSNTEYVLFQIPD